MAPQIIFKHLTYCYSRRPIRPALSDMSFIIHPGSFTCIVGQTGSGKSTLIQQINGLLRPNHGLVKVGSVKVQPKMDNLSLKKLRREVGLVFQLAQDQLFGETVKNDLEFGPLNFGFNSKKIKTSVQRSVRLLKLNNLLSKSPFDLSGGQMKRVAIAGVLACQPKILILDEPTVGLDNYSETRLMSLISRLHHDFHLTVIMVTHQMNLVAKYATQVLVLKRGRLIANLSPVKLFNNQSLLKQTGLTQPFAVRIATRLNQMGIKLPGQPLTTRKLANEIIMKLNRMRHYHE